MSDVFQLLRDVLATAPAQAPAADGLGIAAQGDSEFALARAAAAAVAPPPDVRYKKWVARSRAAAERRVLVREQDAQQRARRANEQAVRPGDIVALQGRRSKAKGRRADRRWLPRPMLRVAFGVSSKKAQGVKQVRSKRHKRRKAAPVAASARASADQFQGGHGHVQQIRDCLAHALLRGQQQAIEHILSKEQPSLAVLELRFDETHHEMKLPNVSNFAEEERELFECGHYPLVMLKGTFS